MRPGVHLAAALLVLAAGAVSPAPQSLDADIGQMLMVGFRGIDLEKAAAFRRQLEAVRPGGVILSDYDVPGRSRPRNIVSPEQLADLISQLQAASAEPLLVAVDQEGGKVARLKPRDGFPASRSAQSLGRLDSEEATRAEAVRTASLLAGVGVNLNLAPVVDLNLNPANPIIARFERSFGPDPAAVARQAGWVVEEHRKRGVLTTLKHFPGHGSSREDSHLGLPDVTGDWRRVELEPYRTLIRRDLADLVMTAHLFNGRLDAELPASLSRPTTTGLLRGELGFEGVIITDDLGMGALSERWPLEERIRLAIEAGADIVLLANNFGEYDFELPEKAAAAIRNLVASGVIEEERVRQSAHRIRRLKARAGLGR